MMSRRLPAPALISAEAEAAATRRWFADMLVLWACGASIALQDDRCVPRRCGSCPSAPVVDDEEDAVFLSGFDLGGAQNTDFRTFLQSWSSCWRGILIQWKSRNALKLELES